jgi:hypothetical protein
LNIVTTPGGSWCGLWQRPLVEEPGTAIALAVIVGLSVALDLWWKRRRGAPVTIDSAHPSPA